MLAEAGVVLGVGAAGRFSGDGDRWRGAGLRLLCLEGVRFLVASLSKAFFVILEMSSLVACWPSIDSREMANDSITSVSLAHGHRYLIWRCVFVCLCGLSWDVDALSGAAACPWLLRCLSQSPVPAYLPWYNLNCFKAKLPGYLRN